MVVTWAWKNLTAIAFIHDRIPVQAVHLQNFNWPLIGIYYFIHVKLYYIIINIPISTMIKWNRRCICFIRSCFSRSCRGCDKRRCNIWGFRGNSWNYPPHKIWYGFQLVHLHHSRCRIWYNWNRHRIFNIRGPFGKTYVSGIVCWVVVTITAAGLTQMYYWSPVID